MSQRATQTTPAASRSPRHLYLTTFCLSAALATIGWALVDREGLAAASPLIAAAGIIIGIPHGAVDHLVPGWAWQRWKAPGHRGLVVVVYVMVAAIAAVALIQLPNLCFGIFLLASALHFGWAETTFATERRGGRIPRWRCGWSQTIAHGAVVVAIPLWSVQGLAALQPFVPTLASRVVAVPASWVVGGVAACGCIEAARLVMRHRVLQAAELLVVMALFVCAPALAAFGVYFGCWHSVRHTARLIDVLAPGQSARAQVIAFARAAALPTVAALTVLGVLWIRRSDTSIIVTGVSVLLALTFPHIVVVALLDRQRRRHVAVPCQG